MLRAVARRIIPRIPWLSGIHAKARSAHDALTRIGELNARIEALQGEVAGWRERCAALETERNGIALDRHREREMHAWFKSECERITLQRNTLTSHTLLANGLLLQSMGKFDESLNLFQLALSNEPGIMHGKRHLAQAYICLRRFDTALEVIAQALDIAAVRVDPAPDAAPAPRPALPRLAADAGFLIATSLMPRRLDVQQAAVASWLAEGFRVVSVNSRAEIAQLQPLFPQIAFAEARSLGGASPERPLVSIGDVVAVLEEDGADLCGIVNSDIVFVPGSAGEPGLRGAVAAAVGSGLAFGARTDFDDFEDPAGRVYDGGYDLFFFRRELGALFRRDDLVLGMPWWDFWMPVAAKLSGVPVRRLETRRFLHRVHPVGYDAERFLDYGRRFLDRVRDLDAALPQARDSEFERFLRRFFRAVEPACIAEADGASLYHGYTIASFLKFLVQEFSVPVDIDRAA